MGSVPMRSFVVVEKRVANAEVNWGKAWKEVGSHAIMCKCKKVVFCWIYMELIQER